eukprot:gb/GEZN01008749.1/.p1 GENE.gb/GEZN01008749.1/~~gb/GEZN01008749.1/.p1  ORF type:complete len:214 (-),score=12.83 gb/GEZN01008749.1/:727-1368(-)
MRSPVGRSRDETSPQSLGQMTLRSWSEFGQTSGFSVPDGSKLQERLLVNVVYYQANYVMVLLLFLLYTCVARPPVIGVLVVAGVGVVGIQYLEDPVMLDGKTHIPRKYLTVGMLAVSALLLLFFGGSSFTVAIGLSLIICILHAVFRKRSVKSKSLTFFDLWRGGSPAANVFSNSQGDESADEEDPHQPRAKTNEQSRTEFRERMRAKYLKPS